MVATTGGWPNLWGFLGAQAGPLADPPPPSAPPDLAAMTCRSSSASTPCTMAGDGVAVSPSVPNTPPRSVLRPPTPAVASFGATPAVVADGIDGVDNTDDAPTPLAPSPTPPRRASPAGAGGPVAKRARSASPVDVRGEAPRPPAVAALTAMVAAVLDGVAATNGPAAAANLPAWQEDISAFYSVSVPDLSTATYVDRLVTYCKASPAVLLVALVLLDRLGSGDGADPRLRVNGYNLHRLLVTAVMLACKSVEDRTFSAAHFAAIGGVEGAAEMAKLERLMLAALDWRLVVEEETLALYECRLRQRYCALGGDSPASFLTIEA